MSTKSQQNIEREEAIKTLLADVGAPDYGRGIKPGDTIYTILRHRSSSGMSRVIDLFIVRSTPYSDGAPRAWRIGALAAKALGMSYDNKHEGIRTGGCGMDMGFHLVYSLGRVLFPQGFGEESRKLDASYNVIARKRATSPAHAKRMIKQGWEFRGRNGDPTGWDNDGGYALKHEWI